MRKFHIIVMVAGALIGALASSPAAAVTTSHLNIRGTSVNLDLFATLPGDQPGCTLDTSIVLEAASSVEHVGSNKGTGSGAQGFVQMVDSCTNAFAFGSFDVPLGSGLVIGPHTATVNVTIVVAMVQFDWEFNVVGTVDRTLVASALRFDAIQAESFVAKTHTRLTGPGFITLSNGQSNESPANISGGLSLDGAPLLSNPTAGVSGTFQTATQISKSITR